MSLFLKDPRSGLHGIERAVQIHPHDMTPLVGRVVFGGNIGHNARVDDDDIEFTKVGCDTPDGGFDVGLGSDVGLVRACADVVLCGDGRGGGFGVFGGVVDQCNLFVRFNFM